MKSKSITIYSVVISLVFASSVFFFLFSLTSEFTSGAERTGKQFDTLVNDLSSSLSRTYPSSQEFTGAFNAACGNFEDYSFITLKDESSLLYVYPDASASASGHVSHFCKLYTSTFTAGGATYQITSSMYLLRPSSIFYYARFSFLIILAATAFAVILIVYLGISEKQAAAADQLSGEDDVPDGFSDGEAAPDENAPAEEKIVTEDVAAVPAGPAESASEPLFSEEQPAVHAPEETAAEEHAPAGQAHAAQASAGSEPEGLFSPLTGFGWEQYLITRLDSELVRAASSEQDLSLFIIRIPTLSFSSPVTLKICTYLLEQFQLKDMLFEYGSDGFAVIKTNTAVDEAVTLADTLYSGISDILKENKTDMKCAIGISSRSVRILPADRLIKEATEALEHAFTEPDSPIIAFRANADKYRKFIENKN